jgi:hypothetical protein
MAVRLAVTPHHTMFGFIWPPRHMAGVTADRGRDVRSHEHVFVKNWLARNRFRGHIQGRP